MLYLALEGGRCRIQRRLRAIQPGIKTAGEFYLLYSSPLLNDGGLECLRRHIESGRYRLIVIDPLLMVAPACKGCRQICRMLAGLQELRRQHPFCLAMLMPMPMAEIDRVFDAGFGPGAPRAVGPQASVQGTGQDAARPRRCRRQGTYHRASREPVAGIVKMRFPWEQKAF